VANQRLAAGKAWFRMTSQGGKRFVPGHPAAYGNLFEFDGRNKVVLRPGITIPYALSAIRKGRPDRHVPPNPAFVFPDEVDGTFREGAVKTVTVNAYERDRRARQQCIRKYGPNCCVCRLSFEQKYGPEFRGLIHVHHLKALYEIGKGYRVHPERDLRPVCPNCHAALHRRVPPYSIEDIVAFLKRNSRRNKNVKC
jgi:hypothetical protein